VNGQVSLPGRAARSGALESAYSWWRRGRDEGRDHSVFELGVPGARQKRTAIEIHLDAGARARNYARPPAGFVDDAGGSQSH